MKIFIDFLSVGVEIGLCRSFTIAFNANFFLLLFPLICLFRLNSECKRKRASALRYYHSRFTSKMSLQLHHMSTAESVGITQACGGRMHPQPFSEQNNRINYLEIKGKIHLNCRFSLNGLNVAVETQRTKKQTNQCTSEASEALW